MNSLLPVAPYTPAPPQNPKPCRECGADLMRERHVATCPELAEIHRLAFDPEGKRLENHLAAATRRAFRAWLAAGRSF
jgi:hypothetical protein